MGLKATTLIMLVILSSATLSYGGWQGPTVIISGDWGPSLINFGIERGDTSDDFPSLAAILFDGRIVISDQVNEREAVYDSNGVLFKIVPWYVNQNGSRVTNPEYSLYQYWNVQGYTPEGNIWIRIKNYILKAPTGQIIKTSPTKPLELGQMKTDKMGEGTFKVTITYPDKTYGFSSDRRFLKLIRDSKDYIYGINSGGVWRFNQCGRLEGRVLMPHTQKTETPGEGAEEPHIVIKGQYGEPVVASNGDVYTWKKTSEKYSILKWTWQDDPNVPTGPDAPTGLTVMPSTTGIYLTWTASPQDPGCVTGYEIARATSSGGVYSNVATVEKDIIKYNDTTASTGNTYYYKVRAVADSEYSQYTSVVSGKKP